MTYILPLNAHNASGGQLAHLNIDDRPACGAPLPDRSLTDNYLMSWNFCPICKALRAAERIQLSLFSEVQP